MTYQDMLNILLPQRRLAEESSDQLRNLLRQEIDEMTIVEKEENIGLVDPRKMDRVWFGMHIVSLKWMRYNMAGENEDIPSKLPAVQKGKQI